MPSGNAAKKSGKGDKQKRKESYTIYIYKATKAVDKYSRKGYKEVRQQRQEGLCCPERCLRTPSTSTRLPRLSTSTAGKAAKKSGNGDKKARAAQRGAQGHHLHLQGYQGCRQLQQERLQRSPATATRRLVLPREVPKDAIYIYKATKAVNKYSRKGCKEVRQRRQEGSCCQERCPRTPSTSTRLPRLLLPRILNLL